ncbi:MAG: hypothetical protein GYA41_11380 [Bacteroidales bacterium]|nr:hypothetical protein [Bacteroidales bacterium]
MSRLLVASFKDDPEYEGIEPQMLDSPAGKGLGHGQLPINGLQQLI